MKSIVWTIREIFKMLNYYGVEIPTYTILELVDKTQELQNEINCMDDSRDFQDAELVRSGNSHVPSWPVSLPPHSISGGMPNRSIGMPGRREGPPSIWDTFGSPLLDLSSYFVIIYFMHRTLYFSGHHNVRCVNAGFTIDGIAISIPYSSRIFTIRTSKIGPMVVPSAIAATTWDWGKDRESCIPGM